MKNIIIGTAGHVDHGKTQLIRALSGIDTDRLEEEKKRGITIELGFAHIPNDDGYNIGVIDVPGHEKFIKNMLAGIGGIDFVLFVVAADEGIMPQTKEHFEILQALGIDDGIVAVTKTDMVDEEWLEMLISEVEGFVKGSFLEGKPIVPVSSKTGDNIQVLKEELIAKCDRKTKRREEKELFRLPVDRVFSMSGFGTVVTGTLVDGTVKTGDQVFVQPQGIPVKIRGIQTYGKETDTAIAGQRTAINISNIKKEDIERGDVLAAKDSVSVTNMLDVKLKVFSSSDRIIFNNSRVHLYSGAKEVLCKVVLLDRDSLAAGEETYAQLRLEEPMTLRRKDKFIIRFYSPIITVGGGEIIDVMPDKHKRNKENILKNLDVLSTGSVSDAILIKAGRRHFLNQDEIARELGILPKEMDKLVDDEISSGKLIRLSDGSLVNSDKFNQFKENLEKLFNKYLNSHSLAEGMPKQELLSKLREQLHAEDEKLIQAILRYFLETSFLVDKGKTISMEGYNVQYTDEQKALKSQIAEMYKSAGLEMIKNDTVFELDKDKNAIGVMLNELVSEGLIRKVNPSYYILSESWDRAVEAAKSLESDFTLAEYRDKLETSRKYAMEFLATMDKEGITIFNGETRTVVNKK
ncbi:MAG: selenocysteine-specific translation elongation factor [Clostridiales bacterium]|nr:selenocysteine-specific translation elongation factor [Clostridiales bacterium]